MQLNATEKCMKRLFKIKSCLLFVVLLSLQVFGDVYAGQWGLSLGYNNPLGANIGGNLIYFGDPLAFEVGIGSVGGHSNNQSSSAALAGDMDIKVLFGSKFQPYLEFGLALGIGAGVGSGGGLGLGLGSPFVGGGLMYSGQTVFCYGAIDYSFNAKGFYPALGVGVKF